MSEFKYQLVIENDYKYSEENILFLLDNNKNSLIHLLERSYLKKSTTNNQYAFSFVGVITINDIIICCYPKYYQGYDLKLVDQSLVDFSNLIKVFKHFNKNDEIPDYDSIDSNNIIEVSEIVLADKIIRHYLDYGLYNKLQAINELNGDGEVNWSLTVSSLDPIFSKKQIIYTSTFNDAATTEQSNIIKEIQKWAIAYSLNKYGKILDYDFKLNEDYITDIKDINHLDFLIITLQKELRITYLDRDVSLLKLLVQFLKRTDNAASEHFDLYGTGYFHVIWEKVCSDVFSNQMDKFKQHIPKPKWFNLEGESYVDKNTLIPDIIVEKDSTLYILDAKYYPIKYLDEPFSVSGNPGISDVSKQFLYEKTFRKTYDTIQIKNAFLYPSIQEEFMEIKGYVKFDLFKDSKIYNITLSPQQLFSSFLANETRLDCLEKLYAKANK